ncbi:hypothetical protein [Gaopeijia maritima]|uniref:Uncharacterized protein n=1 Tax=Gaopeijia maritima TaxID=3119007 RepID=A0ABU9E7N3_9BACT
MPDRTDLWYRLGYALESARHGQARASLDALTATRRSAPVKDAPARPPEPVPESGARPAPLDLLLAAGTGSLVTRLLGLWPERSRPGLGRLLRAAAAGAGATALRELLVPLLEGRVAPPEWDDESADRLLAGAARGLLYAGVLDPRLPGPAALRGAAYGAGEYLLTPWGGLRAVLGRHTPWRRLPVVSSLLDDPEGGEEAFLDHLAFGVLLGLLYGEGDELRIGIGIEER